MGTKDWIRDLDIRVGPIVGYTDQHSTRIWAQAADDQPLVLRIAAAAGEPAFDPETGGFSPVVLAEAPRRLDFVAGGLQRTGQITIGDLQPDRTYFYELVFAGRATGSNGFASAQPLRLRTLPEIVAPDHLRFAFMSCNGLADPPRGLAPTAMWRRLAPVVLGDPSVRFALFGGDQIYADSIRDQWLAENEPDDSLSPDAAAALVGELERSYARIYAAWWRRPDIRLVLAQLPCLMTWDDHDIYDGWGSHGDEHLDAQQAFFAAAARTFDAFQLVHAPLARARRLADHRGFDFRFGAIGFIVLDLRSCRDVRSPSKYALLGDAQWAWFKAALENMRTAAVRQLVVVTSVPPVFADRWVSRLPRVLVGGLQDDLADQWASPRNRNDQLRLFGTLFEFRRATGANVLVLGGDIHMATIGGVRTHAARFLRDAEMEAVVHQGVSSGIGYKSVSGFAGGIIERHVEGDHSLSTEFTGFVRQALRARNFAIVDANTEDLEFDFAIHLEDCQEPFHHRFGGIG